MEAYVQLLEAEVAYARTELAEYQRAYDVKFMESVDEDPNYCLYIPSRRMGKKGRYFLIANPTFVATGPLSRASNTQQHSTRLLLTWLNLDIECTGYLEFEPKYYGYGGIRVSERDGSVICLRGIRLDEEYHMTKDNAERVVHEIAAHFTIGVQHTA